MRIIASGLLAALALAGCNKATVDETNASVEEVANAVAEAKPDMNFRPGRWETTTEFVSLDAPGLPPQAQEMMKKQMAVQGQKVAVCLRPEDVQKPDGRFFGVAGKDCRFDHYKMGGGSIDAKMTCTPPDAPGAVVATMKGNYSPEHYAMDMTSQISAGRMMTIHMKMTSTRTGDCTGSEEAADSTAA